MPRHTSSATFLLGAALVLLGACGGDVAAPREGPSARALPEPTTTPGQERTTVPEIPYGWSVERAERRLARAGLVGESPDVDWPHYAVGTEPAAGTRVDVGSTVRISIGDG